MIAPLAILCPTCFSGVDNTAYFVTFVIMSLLPLLSMAAVIYWLVRRARAHDARDEQRSRS